MAAEGTLSPDQTTLTEADAAPAGARRGKTQQQPEAVDELAQETQRTTLLDRVETQLKGQQHISRLLIAFTTNEEKKTPNQIDQEIRNWRHNQENQCESLTGVLIFVPGAAIQLLEGPTDVLFKALEFLQSLSGGDGSKDGEGQADHLSSTISSAPLITQLRILHFTELHAVRASRSWCSVANPSKPQGGNQVQMDDSNSPEFVYAAYNKLLVLCLKAKEQCSESTEDKDLSAIYKRTPELMPGVDEVSAFMAKGAAETFFTYAEFEKVFVAPFNLVLHSELLWPMPQPLSY